jgi:precorrin-2 dehydrogenase / sirohydrochlorin ferrochelatase
MIPLALDPKYAHLALAGNGALALRRLRILRSAGATEVMVFADAPEPALAAEAGRHLRRGLPDEAELGTFHAIWIVDLAHETAAELAAAARRARVLVNVEDVPEFCDFHSVAEVRRGDLLLTVSTQGTAPGLAGRIRRDLENCFGPEWKDRVSEVSALRRRWQTEGVTMPEAAKRIDALVEERCWLTRLQTH